MKKTLTVIGIVTMAIGFCTVSERLFWVTPIIVGIGAVMVIIAMKIEKRQTETETQQPKLQKNEIIFTKDYIEFPDGHRLTDFDVVAQRAVALGKDKK